MVEKIRRKTITKKLNAEDTTVESGGDIGFSDVSLVSFDAPEEAGWIEQCSEQRFLIDKALNQRISQMKQIVDNSMEKFLRSQQMHQKF